LTSLIEVTLPQLPNGVPRASRDRLEGPMVDQITAAIGEIERLMGDAAARQGRRGDLYRHMHFGEGHDWHDIYEVDWPPPTHRCRSRHPNPTSDLSVGHQRPAARSEIRCAPTSSPSASEPKPKLVGSSQRSGAAKARLVVSTHTAEPLLTRDPSRGSATPVFMKRRLGSGRSLKPRLSCRIGRAHPLPGRPSGER
jgi:hypothetical protein